MTLKIVNHFLNSVVRNPLNEAIGSQTKTGADVRIHSECAADTYTPRRAMENARPDYVALRYGARFEQYLNRLQTMDLDRVSSRIGPL